MLDHVLQQLAKGIRANFWLAPLLVLLAGLLTSFTPCSLTSIPLIIAYVGGLQENNTKKALACSLIFSLGSAVSFTSLGILASTAGKLMGNSSRIWYLLLGTLMLLMALQTWGVYTLIPSSGLLSRNKRRGYAGAFLAGILGGIFSSPCATPVLIVLLALIADRGSLLWGILLMLLYSFGHSTLVLVAGTSLGFVQKLNRDTRYQKASRILKSIMGTLILLIGLYMFYLAF